MAMVAKSITGVPEEVGGQIYWGDTRRGCDLIHSLLVVVFL